MDFSFVSTDELLAELSTRYDGVLFAAYATPQNGAIAWKWWRKGPVTMQPFVLAVIERQMRLDLEQMLTPPATE